jgi:glycosyltransferase involved in cell wall biosynthesis
VSWGKTNFRITELKNTIGTDFRKQLDFSVNSMREMAKAMNLVSVMGPVASRSLSEFRKYALDMAPVLAQERLDKMAAAEEAAGKAATAAGIANDKAKEKAAAHTAKLKRQAEAAKEAAKALAEDYARALEDAAQLVKDKFAPALMRANEQLTNATNTYNDFYNATRDVVFDRLRRAKGCIFPSTRESMGLVPFEANCCGVPVVYTIEQSHRFLEPIGANVRVPRRTLKKYSEAIRQVDAADYNKDQIRHKVVELFPPSRIKANVLNLLD